MTSEPRYSVVVPAFNEEHYLPRLLQSLQEAREAYRGASDAVEVIVADNASTDGTARVAGEYGCRVVPVEKRCIAAARNGGAAAARGQVLAFIDADSQVHRETFNAIDGFLATGRVIGGATGVRFERSSTGIRAMSLMLSCMAAAFGVPRTYAGVVFCPRVDFETVGGYDERLLFAEDADFLLKLRKLGRSRRQKLNQQRIAPALFSLRKFDKHGDWHYFTLPPRIGWEALFRRTDSARKYWYESR